jgi:hypothetical protein
MIDPVHYTRPVADFDRTISIAGSSLARWRHRRDQKEVNSHYWISVLQADLLARQIRPLDDADGPPNTALGLRGTADRNVGHNIAELRRRIKISDRWRRLSTLLLASSALERYIIGASTAAIESDPLLEARFPKMLDGAALKKRGLSLAQPSLTPLTVGEWSARLRALEKTFGDLPASVRANEGQLEKIRKMRNSIAHEFGSTDSEAIPPSALLVAGARMDRAVMPGHALSENQLLKYLDVLNKTSVALDDFLVEKFIGNYEIMAVYLDWQKSPDSYEKTLGVTLTGHKRSHEQRFSNFISIALDIPVTAKYMRAMDAYINRL